MKTLLLTSLLLSSFAFAVTEDDITLTGPGLQSPFTLRSGVIETGPRSFRAIECDCIVRVPNAEWEYDIDATINVNVVATPDTPVAGEKVHFTLTGEELTLTATHPGSSLLLTKEIKVTKGELQKDVKHHVYDVTIKALSPSAITASIAGRNAVFNNNILTYETGPLSGIETDHSFWVKTRGQVWQGSINNANRQVIAIEGGLRHTIDFTKALEKFKPGKDIHIILDVSVETWKGNQYVFFNNPSASFKKRIELKQALP